MVKIYNMNGVLRAFDKDGKYVGTVKEVDVWKVENQAYIGMADDSKVISDKDAIANAIKAEHEVDIPQCNCDCATCDNFNAGGIVSELEEGDKFFNEMPPDIRNDIENLLNEDNIIYKIEDGILYYLTDEGREKGDTLISEYFQREILKMLDGLEKMTLDNVKPRDESIEKVRVDDKDGVIVVTAKNTIKGLDIVVDIIGKPDRDILNKMYISLGQAVFKYNQDN